VYDDNNSRFRLFYLDVKGSVERFSSAIDAYMVQTTLLKEVLKKRNNENKELNHFIEKSILLHEDLLDIVKQKLELYYKEFLKEN